MASGCKRGSKVFLTRAGGFTFHWLICEHSMLIVISLLQYDLISKLQIHIPYQSPRNVCGEIRGLGNFVNDNTATEDEAYRDCPKGTEVDVVI